VAEIRIGFSGWTFPGWKGRFYPKGVSAKRELEYASRQVNSIEINGTFYSIMKPHSFQGWFDQTPDDFVFSVKANQYITHVRRLVDFQAPLANFLASGLLKLEHKLGPILWQFPPNVTLKDDRFEKFLEELPRDTFAAAEYADRHKSDWIKANSWTKPSKKRPIRHAFEFRHLSFKDPKFIQLLRRHNVAVVFAHSGSAKSPYMEDLTSDFVYARMHGQATQYKKGYDTKTIDIWEKRVKLWTLGKQPADADVVLKAKPKPLKRDTFIYFDTEEKKYAPQDAQNLMKKLGIKSTSED
jgi:uncharacterized protein YecE (DUF72 family)